MIGVGRKADRLDEEDSRRVARNGLPMISSEVQRTLVKSPPELWAELSDPESLARHLNALGEIRITRTEPEQLVEWEATGTTGSVRIKPSGWGTKVTLSVTRELARAPGADEAAESAPDVVGDGTDSVPEEAAAAVEPQGEPTAEPHGEVEASPPDPEPVVESVSEAEPVAETELVAEAEPVADEPLETRSPVEHEPAPRPGLFARLLGRLRNARAAEPEPHAPEHAESEPGLAIVPPHTEAARRMPGSAIDAPQARYAPEVERHESPAVPAADAAGQPAAAPASDEPTQAAFDGDAEQPPASAGAADASTEAEQDAEASTAPDLAAELQAAEDVTAEEVKAVLVAVLDRLGAAHHRPFSRA